MLNNLSWRSIRAFLHVVEHGSFTAAAEFVGCSKAHLSQQVSELEAELGVQLLHRTTRKLRPTEVGKGYYLRCQQAVQQLDAAADWATQSMEVLKGSIQMNAVGGPIGEEVLTPLVIEFKRQHPEIELHLDFSGDRVDLIQGQYDLVVRMGDLPSSTLVARKLYDVTTHYVASAEYLSQCGSIRRPEDLRSQRLIYGSVEHWVLQKARTQRLVRVSGGMKLLSGRAMRHAALAGLGVTRLADIYVQADLMAGRLLEVLPDWAQSTPLYMVCPPARHQLLRVRALMDFLKTHFSERYQHLLVKGLY